MEPDQLLPEPQPLAGQRLYSPRAIAAYSVLFNFPLAGLLLGLNLRARGSRVTGAALISLSVLGEIALLGLAHANRAVRGEIIFGVVGGYIAYQLERRPFAVALTQGAAAARWWPPAAFVLVAGGFLALGVFMWSR